jgi:hypothetical protein
MPNKWLDSNPIARDSSSVVRAGRLGGNFQCSNACKIDRTYHYNGSGPNAFGGAARWPVLSVEVDFCEGDEAKRDLLDARIRKVIEEFLP